MATIYKIIDLRNNKCVVGKTMLDSKYYFTSSKIVNQIIEKHGWDQASQFLKREIVVQGNFSDTLLSQLEIHYIRLFCTRFPNGYNLTDGGEGQLGTKGWKHPEERKRRVSEKLKGRKLSERELIALSKNSRQRWQDPVFKAKVMATRKATLAANPQIAINIGLKHKGKVLSEKTKQLISKSLVGKIQPWTGVPHTKEHKENLKKAWANNREFRLKTMNLSGLKPKPRRVTQCTLEGKPITTFDSLTIASEVTGIGGGGICQAARGILSQSGGFIWRYADQNKFCHDQIIS